MKLLTLFFSLFLLAGCSTEQSDTSEMETSTEVVSNESTEAESTETESILEEESETEESALEEEADEADEESVAEEEIDQAEVIDNNTMDYPEIATIQQEIELTDLTGHVISDNPGTRILIFTKDGKQVYKSIFVKEKSYLKLIDLEQNNLLLNETVPAS